MITALREFDRKTAAGILARTALAMEFGGEAIANPAASFKVPNEAQLREDIVAEVRRLLHLDPRDQSPAALERVGDRLDEESDSLLGPTDTDSALRHLSDLGQLPSDLFGIEIVHDIEVFHGRDFAREKAWIVETVRAPDAQQHYGPAADENQPYLISLFAKAFAHSKYPARGFTMLVAGQRDGLTLTVHQAWRIYPDEVNLSEARTLVDLLKSFSDRFGAEIAVGGQKGHFIMAANLPRNQPIQAQVLGRRFNPEIAWEKNAILGNNSKGSGAITLTFFHQPNPKDATTTQAALIVAIDLKKYAAFLKKRGW